MPDLVDTSLKNAGGKAGLKRGRNWRPIGRLSAGMIMVLVVYFGLKTFWHFDLLQLMKDLYRLKYFSQLGQDAGYGLLFVLGLLTSFHCVGMCGGITISQTIRYQNKNDVSRLYGWLAPATLYNTGRVAAYTLVGAIVGGLGQVIGFSGMWKGIIPIFGGLFMIIMGINLLGIFPFLRRTSIPVPKFFAKKILGSNSYSPFYIGLLTGLMPCGPLQIVQLYALGTRSVIFGALSMFVFSLGTVPLLFSFGAINTFIHKKNIDKILKVSALLVIMLGFVMTSRGLALSGFNIYLSMVHPSRDNLGEAAVSRMDGGVQTVTISIGPDSFAPIVVQKDIPVRWMIQVDPADLNECNKAIHSSKLNINQDLSAGENVIEFTPREEGEFVYTCWMGMIKDKIIVVEDLDKISTEKYHTTQEEPQADELPAENGGAAPEPSTEKTTAQSVAQERLRVSEQENPKSSSTAREDLQTTMVQGEPGAGAALEPSTLPLPPKPTTITKTILISGMICQACVQYMENELSAVEGVQSVEAVIGRATVVLDREVADETLKAAVEKEGTYKVTSISAGASPSGAVN